MFITGVETGGQIWRVLFNRVLVSSTIFQLVMIGVLNMKSARIPSLALAPLPIITVIFKIVCNRRFDPHVYYYTPKMEGPASYPSDYKDGSYGHADKGKNNIGIRFGDPAFFAELPVPMVHEKVRHLLPKLYGTGKSIKKPFVSRMTRQKSVRHLSVVQLHNNGAGELQFQSVGDKDLELDDSTEGTKGMYKFNDDDESMNVVDAPNTSYYSNSFSSNQSHGNGFGAGVLRRLSNRVASPFTHHRTGTNGSNDIYAPNRPLVASTPEEQDSYDVSPYYDQSPGPVNRQMTQDMEYFVAGRSYRTHDPSTLDSSNVIEMANIYREQQAHNPIDQGYHYKTPVGAYIGNRLKHHPTNERSQQNHDYAHSNVSNAGPEWQ